VSEGIGSAGDDGRTTGFDAPAWTVCTEGGGAIVRCSGGSGDTICIGGLFCGCSAAKDSLCAGSAEMDGADGVGSGVVSGRSGVAGMKGVGLGIAGVVFGSTRTSWG